MHNPPPSADQPWPHLDWDGLEHQLRGRLRSSIARAEAERAGSTSVLAPGLEQALARLGELDGLAWLLTRSDAEGQDFGGALASALGRIEDMRPSLEVARSGGRLTVPELVGVRELLRAVEGAARLLDQPAPGDRSAAAGLDALCRRIGELSCEPQLRAALERSIDWDEHSEGGEPRLADAASPALAGARRRLRDRRHSRVRRAESLLRGPDYSAALMDAFWTERQGRVVLPFRSGGLGHVRTGIIHDSSASGQTTFVEPPELIAENNAVRQAELAVAEEERRILAELSRQVAERSPGLLADQAALVELDRVWARLALGDAMQAVCPVLSAPEQARRLWLPGARHPAMVLDGVQVVANDLEVERGRALVITGPNAGGKTVALKTIGLCVLMARAGLRVPTSAPAEVPFYRHVITDLGDDQSIAANLSTFSAHVGHLQRAIDDAESDGAGTLVLLDEVAVGTDPRQGAALAEAVLVHLVAHGATVVVTTHYERLKRLAAEDPTRARFANAAVGFDLERLRPTFRINLGVPGASGALAVARRLGLSATVLDHAQALLGEEGLRVEALLAEVEAERERLARTQRELDGERAALEHERKRLAAREHEALEGARSRKLRALESATEELRELENELKQRRKELRKRGETDLPDRGTWIGDARERVESHRGGAESPAAAPSPEPLEIGTRVFVPTLAAAGEIVAIKGDRITVRLPHLRTTVARTEVRIEPEPTRRSGRRAAAEPIYSFEGARRHFGADAKPFDPGLDAVVDVRGLRIDEVVSVLELALSEALARDVEIVVVKHGHGSGQLRNAVREHLRRLAWVVQQRPGLPAEGGDAVTVVWIGG